MTGTGVNGDTHEAPLDADLCDEMIDQFRVRIEALQRDATEVRQEFDRLHRHWLARVERRQ